MKGDDLILLIGPTTFNQIEGLRATGFSINGEQVNLTSKDSAGWRILLATGGGNKSCTITGGGVWLGSTQQKLLRTLALSGDLRDFQVDDSDQVLEGAFQVTSFDISGDQGAEQQYTCTLESGDLPVVT